MNWMEPIPLAANQSYSLLFTKQNPLAGGTSLPEGPVFNQIDLRPRASLADHIKSDFGVGYAPHVRAWIGLLSIHIYASAINNDTDLGHNLLPRSRQIFSRLSVFAGIAPALFGSDTKQPIKNSTKLGNFIYGVGVRAFPYFNKPNSFGRLVIQSMRLNVGVLRFAQDDANPLITKDRPKSALFYSVTYDYNISTLLGPLGKLLQ